MGFLPKNMSQAEGKERYAPIEIQALSLSTDDPRELELCPVLCLRAYNDWAEKVNPKRDRFWLNPYSKHTPVVKATLSGWIKSTIRTAHLQASDSEATLANARVHELRAISTSLAAQASFSLEDIISKAVDMDTIQRLHIALSEESRSA